MTNVDSCKGFTRNRYGLTGTSIEQLGGRKQLDERGV